MRFDKRLLTHYTGFVGQIDLSTIFIQARDKLILDFSSSEVSQRVGRAKVVVASSTEMMRSLGRKSFYSSSFVSAYYNPNTHRVYLNADVLKCSDTESVFNICYHELIHAATRHRTYKRSEARIFQSGTKVEVFKNEGKYLCLNRALNEGIVEFLSGQFNHIEGGAYQREVELINIISADLGSTILKEAILNAQIGRLKREFNNYYGKRSFERFSRHLDNKKYAQAKRILTKNSGSGAIRATLAALELV